MWIVSRIHLHALQQTYVLSWPFLWKKSSISNHLSSSAWIFTFVHHHDEYFFLFSFFQDWEAVLAILYFRVNLKLYSLNTGNARASEMCWIMKWFVHTSVQENIFYNLNTSSLEQRHRKVEPENQPDFQSFTFVTLFWFWTFRLNFHEIAKIPSI